jgi:hypothetical protein
MMKTSKRLANFVAVLFLLGTIILPSVTMASTTGDFVNNNAPATTVGQGATNVHIMDVTIPDGVNGGTEDIEQKAGSITYWSGDPLNSFTSLGSTAGVGYKDDATAGFQGTEAVVRDLDADSVYTSAADTVVSDHSDSPSAGDALSNTWNNIYYSDSDGSNSYNDGEVIVSSSDAILDSGDTITNSGSADLTNFASTDYSFDDSATNNDDYDDDEAIISEDGDGNLDGGDSITTDGKADVTNFVSGDNVLFDDSDADNEWDSGTDDIFIDLDIDDVYTAAADTIHIDQTDTPAAGDTLYDVTTADNLCSDNTDLASAACVYTDTDGTACDGTVGSGTFYLGSSGCEAGTDSQIATGDNWATTDDTIDSTTDFIKESVAEELTYSAGTDTLLYDGSGTLSAGDAGDEMNTDPEVIYLDSDHDGSYTDGEPLVDVGDGNTLADDGNLATSGHSFLNKASGSWTVDWVQLSTLTSLGYCDSSHTNTYLDGDAIVRNGGGTFATLESTDTIETNGSCDLENSWNAQNLVHTNAAANYDNTGDIIDENVDGELTYSAAADADVYSTGGLSAGDALTDFQADCDGGGAGTQACKYTGSSPINSNDSILIDEDTDNTVDKAEDRLNAITIQNTGSATNSDLTNVTVYSDGGNGTFDAGGGDDSSIGVMSWDGTDSWVLSGINVTVNAGGKRIFVATDITATASTGTIQMYIPTLSDAVTSGSFDAGDEGVFMTSANDGPTNGPITNSNQQEIDATSPTVSNFTISTTLLSDSDVGTSTFDVAVQFDETMDTGVDPTVSFSNPSAPNLTFNSGSWGTTANPNDTYTAFFDFADGDEVINNIDIDVSGGQDPYGNAHSGPSTSTDAFSIDTQNPTVTAGALTADESACTGTGGVCIIGDTITFTWDNTTDGNTDEGTVIADLTNFGGSSTQMLYDDGTNGDASGGDDLYTYDYTVAADNDEGTNTFNLTVVDTAGNSTGPVASSDTAPVDNVPPTVTGYTLSDNLISDGDVGTAVFYIDIDYSENMDASSTPVATFTPDIIASGTLTSNAGASSWQDADTYRAMFDVADVNESVTVSDIIVNNGNDASGNTQSTYNSGAPTGLSVDTQNPTVTAGALTADESACTGTGGVCIIGDTITFTWDNTTDGNTDEATVVADLSNFGGGASQALFDDGSNGDTGAGDEVYTFALTVAADDDDGTNTFDATVTDTSGNSTGPVTSTDTAPVDNVAPTISSPGSLTITTDNNSNGVANVNDTVTYNDGSVSAADGDSWTVDLTGLTGDAAATNAGSPYTVVVGSLSGSVQFTETVTDDAGNTVTGNTAALSVDNRSPLTSPSVSLSNNYTSQTTNFTFNFTTTQSWPADGKFEVVFPSEFNVAGLSGATATSLSNVDGSISVTNITGQTVTFTRDGAGTPVAGSTAVSFQAGSGTNGSTSGTTGTFTFRTQDNAGTLIDVNSTVSGVILASPPAPTSSGGGGGGRRIYTETTTDTTATTETEAETDTPIFSDIEGHWSETYVDQAYNEGYVEGYEDSTFRPDNNINRAEASKLIAMWMEPNVMDEVCIPDSFSDVDCASDWFANFVSYLFENQVVEGYEDGTFGPGKGITRAEALKMLIFAKELQNTDVSDVENPFSDIPEGEWHHDWVMIGKKLGIIEGYGDGTFKPNNPVTRAEFTKMFMETMMNN